MRHAALASFLFLVFCNLPAILKDNLMIVFGYFLAAYCCIALAFLILDKWEAWTDD